MKYLKPFNESITIPFSLEEINDIKDIFQDVIDELNFVKNPHQNIRSVRENEYEIRCNSNLLYVYAQAGRPINRNKQVKIIDSFIERIRLMGYEVYKPVNDGIHAFITIEKI